MHRQNIHHPIILHLHQHIIHPNTTRDIMDITTGTKVNLVIRLTMDIMVNTHDNRQVNMEEEEEEDTEEGTVVVGEVTRLLFTEIVAEMTDPGSGLDSEQACWLAVFWGTEWVGGSEDSA